MSDLISRSGLIEAIKRQCCTGCDNYNGSRCRACHADDMLSLVDDAADAQRWISVEDEQKPKHHEEVLCRYVFDGDSECFYAVLTYYAYGDNGYVTGQHFTGEGLHDMRVTHWTHLPEPPKEATS